MNIEVALLCESPYPMGIEVVGLADRAPGQGSENLILVLILPLTRCMALGK